MGPNGRFFALAVTAALCAAASACSGTGRYVWLNELPAESFTQAESEYVIHDGDLLDVHVFNQDPLSAHARVRSDGRIAMPVIGDIEVRGRRPSAVRADIETRLKNGVLVDPSVTVTVAETQPITVSVLGEVSKAGTYPVTGRANVAQALAAAGGLTEYASKDRIFLVRAAQPGQEPLRIRFTYDDISRGDPRSVAFTLRQGDLVVVE